MRSIRVRSVEPLTNGIRVFSIEKRGLQSWRVATFPTVQVNWREGGSWTGSRGLFRLGYWHCFTVDENLICATERDNLCHHARKGTSNTVCACIYMCICTWRTEGKNEEDGKNRVKYRHNIHIHGPKWKKRTNIENRRKERGKRKKHRQRAVYISYIEDRKKDRGRELRAGWVLACLSVGGGVKLNYPLVLRSPGTFAGALALSVLLRQGYARL